MAGGLGCACELDRSSQAHKTGVLCPGDGMADTIPGSPGVIPDETEHERRLRM